MKSLIGTGRLAQWIESSIVPAKISVHQSVRAEAAAMLNILVGSISGRDSSAPGCDTRFIAGNRDPPLYGNRMGGVVRDFEAPARVPLNSIPSRQQTSR